MTEPCENRAAAFRVAINEPGCRAGEASQLLTIIYTCGFSDSLKLCSPCATQMASDARDGGHSVSALVSL